MVKVKQIKPISKPNNSKLDSTPWQVMDSNFNPLEHMTKKKFRPGVDDRNFFTRELDMREEKIYWFLLKFGLVVLGCLIFFLMVLLIISLSA